MTVRELRDALDAAPPESIVRVYIGEHRLTLTSALATPPHRVEIGNLPVEMELFAHDLIRGWPNDGE